METILLIALFTCHWLADYTHLSTDMMLKAKRIGSPIGPILLHGYVHALLMSIVIMMYSGFRSPLWGTLFVFQFVSHSIIDILKGKMNVWFPSVANPANKQHWYIFGFDQLLHAIVIILMVKYMI